MKTVTVFIFGILSVHANVSPQSPVISNIETDNNRVVYRGDEGQSLTIECISTGGIPAPTLEWYKESISTSNRLAQTSTGTLQSDGTYNVTLQHTLPASSILELDRKLLICRSFYPEADYGLRDIKITNVTLYLNKKPTQPVVTQNSVAVAGGTAVVRCVTTGSRPAASISWSYQGLSTVGNISTALDTSSETYRVESIFRRPVTAAENGQSLQCIVTHQTLANPLTATLNIEVQFRPLNATLTGNRNIIADGATSLSLECISGSSNPISDIKWTIISNDIPHAIITLPTISGDYGGMRRRSRLDLIPTRDDDGHVVTCKSENVIGSSDTTEITLDLKYGPSIDSLEDIVAVEGNDTFLICSVKSKPASTLTWYRQGQIVFSEYGSLQNRIVYEIKRVDRTDAGRYRCHASNGIQNADIETLLLTVHYPPDVDIAASNVPIRGRDTTLTCNANGIPSTNYRYGKWVHKWPGQDESVAEYNGEKHIQIKNLTYEHSGLYSCFVSNGVKSFGSNVEYIEGSFEFIVKWHPVIISASKRITAKLKESVILNIDYFSNIDETVVTLFKNVNGARIPTLLYRYTVLKSQVEINLPVFGKFVQTTGVNALIHFVVESNTDIGIYDIVISNEVGFAMHTVELVLKGPPGIPYNINITIINTTRISFSWIPGNNGELTQTFVIEVSTDQVQWTEMKKIVDEDTEVGLPVSTELSGLREGIGYWLRMHSFNDEGSSPFTQYYNFTTLPSEKTSVTSKSTGIIVGAASGAGAFLFIATIIAVIIIIKQRNQQPKVVENKKTEHIGRTAPSEETQPEEVQVETFDEIETTTMGIYEEIRSTELTRDRESDHDYEQQIHVHDKPLSEHQESDQNSYQNVEATQENNHQSNDYETFGKEEPVSPYYNDEITRHEDTKL